MSLTLEIDANEVVHSGKVLHNNGKAGGIL